MSVLFELAKPNRTVHVGVILMNAETEILDVAPIDMFSGISKKITNYRDEFFSPEMKRAAQDIQFHWVNEKGSMAPLSAGLRIQPTDSFETCPPLDVVVMGAHDEAYRPNEKELAFVRKSYNDCSAFIAICGGCLTPLEAGLLKGRTVTGPAPMLDMLRKLEPDAIWEERRWARDGKLWTSGTLLNGLDLMRAFGEQTYGSDCILMSPPVLDQLGWPVRDVNYNDIKA